MRTLKHAQLEKALLLWFNDMRGKRAIITDDMMITKAKAFGKELAIDETFCYSKGWIACFKIRNEIKAFRAQGEAASACVEGVATGRQEIRTVLEGVDPDDIYNIDETSLYYKFRPSVTLSTKPVQGEKKSKERALCCNATGTDKIRPLFIGKAARPRCFGRDFDPGMYVTYRHNKKAWMNSILWDDLLTHLNARVRNQKKTYVILCDNASSNKSAKEYPNLKIVLATKHHQSFTTSGCRYYCLL